MKWIGNAPKGEGLLMYDADVLFENSSMDLITKGVGFVSYKR